MLIRVTRKIKSIIIMENHEQENFDFSSFLNIFFSIQDLYHNFNITEHSFCHSFNKLDCFVVIIELRSGSISIARSILKSNPHYICMPLKRNERVVKHFTFVAHNIRKLQSWKVYDFKLFLKFIWHEHVIKLGWKANQTSKRFKC